MDTTSVQDAEEGGRTEEHAAIKKTRVMIAIDESDASLLALQWAIDHLFSNKTIGISPAAEMSSELLVVTLVHVQPPFVQYTYPAGPPGVAAFYPPPAYMDSIRRVQAENSSKLLARASQLCDNHKIKAETLILDGDPKDMICQATEQMKVDLLVVGSRGLGMVKRAFLGSVSDYCTHHAKCPVLIVKPPPKEEH